MKILEKARMKLKEEKHRRERAQRKKVDHFWSLLKRFEPEIKTTTEWKEVKKSY